jgi:hypothetical protein
MSAKLAASVELDRLERVEDNLLAARSALKAAAERIERLDEPTRVRLGSLEGELALVFDRVSRLERKAEAERIAAEDRLLELTGGAAIIERDAVPFGSARTSS